MKFSWRTECPHWFLLTAMLVVAGVCWTHVPERMAIHWDLEGNPNGYGGRFAGLLLLPLMNVGIYALVLVLPRFDPRFENYKNFATAFNTIRLSVTAFLGVVYAVTVAVALGVHVDVTAAILLTVGLLFIVLGNLMSKLRPNWFIGVRTPWTLSSRASWNKTHRLAGWLFIGMGLLFLPLALFRSPWVFVPVVVIDVACLFWIIIYSYQAWRDDPQRAPLGSNSSLTD